MSELISRRELTSRLGALPIAAAIGAAALTGAASAADNGTFAETMLAAWEGLDPQGKAFMRTLANCDDHDAELKELFVEYVLRSQEAEAAWDESHAERDELERSVFGGKTVKEFTIDRDLTEQERAAWMAAMTVGDHGPWERACECSTQVRVLVERIRATPAEGMAGIGIKLVAVTGEEDDDVVDAVYFALEDLNRLSAHRIELRGLSRQEYFARVEFEDDDEAEGDADV